MKTMEKVFTSALGLVVLCLFALTQVGCSHASKVRDLDTKLDLATEVSSHGSVGVTDGYMVYREKKLLSETMRSLQNEVFDLEARVYGGPRYLDNRGLYGVLKECRTSLGDSDNGGEGKLRWVESRDYVVPENDNAVYGVEDSRRLISLSTEKISDRIERFRDYKKILQDRSEEFDTKIKMCQLELKSQRVAGR